MSFITGTSSHNSASPPSTPSTTTSTSVKSTSKSVSKFGVSIADPDWAENHFAIPWSKMEWNVQEALTTGARLKVSERRSIVRTVVESLRLHREKPLKNICSVVAKRMVTTKYQKSLQDELEGDVIGSGYGSLNCKSASIQMGEYQ